MAGEIDAAARRAKQSHASSLLSDGRQSAVNVQNRWLSRNTSFGTINTAHGDCIYVTHAK